MELIAVTCVYLMDVVVVVVMVMVVVCVSLFGFALNLHEIIET